MSGILVMALQWYQALILSAAIHLLLLEIIG
jgi:hypothetical protein